jgi:Putative MetA-pathway of phenol degradation
MTWRMRGLILLAMLLGWSCAAAADEQPICADRPSKSTGPCTVPAGKWQIETGLVDWTRDKSDGVRTDTTVWGGSGIKYGVSDKADLELWVTPLVTERIHGQGVHEHHSSFGDTLLRVKYRLTKDDAPAQVALDPFVKLPTANHHLGNGKVEGGLLVPMSVQLGKGPLTLSLDPELDLLADADGHGRHLATQQVVNLGVQVNEQLSLSTEVWAQWDWDPAGTGKETSADISAAYLVGKDMQLDAGANFGLNKQTPDVELYTGVSVRF